MFRNHVSMTIVLLMPSLLFGQVAQPSVSAQIAALEAQMHQLQQQLAALKQQVKPVAHTARSSASHQAHAPMRRDWTTYHGAKFWQASAITTSPTLGTKTAFDGSDLLIATSSMQQDYHLLQRRRNLNAQRARFHAPMVRP